MPKARPYGQEGGGRILSCFVPTCFKFYNRFYSEVFYKIKNMVMLTSVPIKEAKEKIFALKRAFYVLIKS
jgi:hypothetical protein